MPPHLTIGMACHAKRKGDLERHEQLMASIYLDPIYEHDNKISTNCYTRTSFTRPRNDPKEIYAVISPLKGEKIKTCTIKGKSITVLSHHTHLSDLSEEEQNAVFSQLHSKVLELKVSTINGIALSIIKNEEKEEEWWLDFCSIV
ncbi:MAG: hypothetical protein H7A37_10070 [Chlamydiales bacterium]|nr:hypothetical protein [Chlamydiia bacterium]MCP5508622.1 hypothetical protein [Chlamydiales bacterium]